MMNSSALNRLPATVAYRPANSGALARNIIRLILTTPPAKVLSGEPTEKFSVITMPPA
jgi:hypothetical protein